MMLKVQGISKLKGLSVLVLAAALASGSAAASPCRVTVTEARTGLEAAAAGLQAGDCIRAWRRGADGEALLIADPLDLIVVELEQAPRGGVQLKVERDGQPSWLPIASGNWGVQALPELNTGDRTRLLDWAQTVASDPTLPFPPLPVDEPRARASLALWRAGRLGESGAQASDALYGAIIEALQTTLDPTAMAVLGHSRCVQNLQGWLFAQAIERCGAAAADFQRLDLPVAALRARQAQTSVLRQSGRFAEAEAALTTLEQTVAATVPESLQAIGLMHERAALLRQQERLDEALAVAERGLARLNQIGSADRLRLSFTSTLGVIQRARGEHDAAEALLQQAVVLSERIAPDSIQLARDLNNLSLIQWDRMDMARAQQTLDRALDIKRRRGASAVDLAATLGNLALIAQPLGRIDDAERYINEALAIYRQGEPTLVLANTLTTAGRIADNRGNSAAAYAAFDEALTLYRQLAPDSSLEAWAHHFKAGKLAEDGRLDAALGEAKTAVRLQRRISPGGRDLSFGLLRLAEIQRDLGQLDAAAAAFDETIALRRKHSPDSQSLADALYGAGTVAGALGQLDQARSKYCEAVAMLERQRLRWTQSRDDLLELGRNNVDVYRACAVAWLDADDPVAAFDVLEQSRARLLLDNMARHRAELIAALPKALAEQWRALQELAATLDSEQLQAREQALQRAVQAQAPAQAALLLTRPLPWAQLRERIGADTVVITHLHDHERFWIVVAQRGERAPRFVRVGAPADEILPRAHRFTQMVRTPAGDQDSLDAEGRWLYQQLLAPVEALLRAGDRLLWIADIELSLLPPGALIAADGRYLIESRALRQAASLSSAALARPPRQLAAGSQLLAIADPAANRLSLPSMARWRSTGASDELPALPGAAAEARSIVSLYGGTARALLGSAATERAVRSLAPQARRLHFAVHGLIDPLRPLDSALVLAPGDGSVEDDGLLLAADLLAGPPLTADLVAVSACDLGSGRVYPGEGLLGLRYALHAAGAAEVVSSLWPVVDQAGAQLMTRFHRELHAGQGTDRALQIAQQDMIDDHGVRDRVVRGVGGLITQGRASARVHPFYWAGFVLDGGLD